MLHAGAAEKLAGRLTWATQFMFYKLGRAMIRPIYDQKRSKTGTISRQLRAALQWWLYILDAGICEEHPWEAPETPLLHLFVDARGEPARCAAVLFSEEGCFYTDGKPSAAIMAKLTCRKDSQIMALEQIAIALGLGTFADKLRHRKVVLYSDNKAAEAATVRGSAKCWDHCSIVHQTWAAAALNHTHVWIERVPSKFNISDSPSREEYDLLLELGAVRCEPRIIKDFLCQPGLAEI